MTCPMKNAASPAAILFLFFSRRITSPIQPKNSPAIILLSGLEEDRKYHKARSGIRKGFMILFF